MVKARTDPSAPAAVLQLLAEIESAAPSPTSQDGSSSNGKTLEATALIQKLVSLLERCLDLIYDSEQLDQLSPYLKYGLDGLRLWANRTGDLLQQAPLIDCLEQCRERILGSVHQIKLSNVIWLACHSERTQISTRSKTVIEVVISLLHRLNLSKEQLLVDSQAVSKRQKEERHVTLSFPQQSAFLSDLITRSFTQLERKQAPIILDVLLSKYGSAPFREAGPGGTTYTDTQIYERIVKGLSTVDGGANKRSRLALGFLLARANDLGCKLSRKALTTQSADQAAQDKAWDAWTSIWLLPLKRALEDGGERLRSGLASYHMAILFDMNDRVFGLLLNSLMKSQPEINVEAVFMTLRMGKTLGYCRISDCDDFSIEIGQDGTSRVLIPAVLLKDCILSAASELQISTLSLVIESKTPALPFNPSELEVLRSFFPYSLTISNPGARGELRGFFVKMLTRLRASSYALARDSGKITRIEEQERLPEEKTKLAELQRDLTGVEQFLKWVYGLIRQTLHPGASYQASITALTFLDLILESGIDPRFAQPSTSEKSLTKNTGMTLSKNKQVFVQEFPFTLDLISPALVQLLLSCSERSYDDIQRRALTILARFPSPLPGLTDKEAAASRILGRAAQLMTSTRDFESAAASRLVQLYKAVYIKKLSWAPSSLLSFSEVEQEASTTAISNLTKNHEIQLINDHLNFLSYHVSVAEKAQILEAATSHPVHGTLVTLQELFASVQVSELSEADFQSFSQAIEVAKQLVDRTWDVTKAVLCNSAPEGSVGAAAAEESANDGSKGLHQPTHESARAMRIADQDGKADALEQQEESIAGPKHQVILSYSWRGMKEASTLLGVLIALKLKASTKRDGDDSLWTKDSIESIGARFNLWLTQVRHRGAFSTIYPAYCNVAAAIVRSGWKEVEGLPCKWIQTFLEAVAQPGTTLSITRRSAGIGYAVLALVSAHPNKTDSIVLVETVNRLIEISNQGTSNSKTNVPVSAIHALNILRVLVSDGTLSEFMTGFIGQLMELTISRFSSKFWGLRNVSMMLFSSLCIRCFSSRHTNKDTKEARMPVDEFFATYPNLDEFLRRTLDEKTAIDGKADDEAESSVFAVLMLFSRMQAPEVPSANQRYSDRLGAFAALIERCASSTVWKIREMAAKAYSAVVPLASAAEVCTDLLNQSCLAKHNELHGRLLIVQRLLRSIKESGAPSASLQVSVADLAASLRDSAEVFLSQNRCAVTQVAYLEVLQDFAGVQPAAFGRLADGVFEVARPWAVETLSSEPQKLLLVLYGPTLLAVCTRTLLQASSRQIGSDGDKDSFLTVSKDLVSHSIEDVRLAILEAVAGDEAETLKKAFVASADGPANFAEFGQKIHQLIANESEGIWIRVNAAEVLHCLLSGGDTDASNKLAGTFFKDGLVEQIQALTWVAKTTPCVPLREALLPYLADLCRALCSSSNSASESSRAAIEDWCAMIAKCADDYASVQSREASCLALRAIGSYLFSSHPLFAKSSQAIFAARLASIQLLTDDDEDVRIEAAAMIGETITVSTAAGGRSSDYLEALTRVARSGGASSEVSTDRACEWMASCYKGEEDNVWTQHVWRDLVPAQDASDREFEEAFSPSTMLFAEEKPNQFRDPEAGLRRAFASIVSGRIQPPSKALAASLSEQIVSDIHKLSSLVRSNDSKNDQVATHLLATRLVLAYNTGLVAKDAELDNVVKNIVDSLGLDIPEAVSDGATAQKASYCIAMVSDFFFPNVGGVEGHIYLVSQRLLELGHKVIVITHAYKDRVGVRHLSSGLKVYYVPYKVIARQDTLPNFFSLFPMVRSILIREQVQIVHGHQALSSMAHEGILHARTMGLRAVFTDHSLFGFADAASILTNKLLRFALSDVDHVVCVSHTGKENTTLRANLDPHRVSVIPNAVVAEHFLPDQSRMDTNKLTVVILSRLMYRKGIDLLIASIPRLCAAHSDLHFLIGGDGPKRVELEQMRERYAIQDRVELVGAVRQGDVRAHLTRGTIFLNTSLTEAFGTGIIEAACAGLFVVSTRVGGVPEVLPPDMIELARPEEDDVVRAMESAISHVRSGAHDPISYHARVRTMYSWTDIATRLEAVYASAMDTPFPTPTERLQKYYNGGPIAGKIFCIIVAVDMLFLRLLAWWLPDEAIDRPRSVHWKQREEMKKERKDR